MIDRCKFLHNLPCEQVSDRIAELEEENAKLHDVESENAKLREQIRWLKKGDVLHVLTDQELADQQKHEREVQASITALESENAKLRDLARIMHSELVSCEDNGYVCGGHKFDQRVRELGVVVE